MATLYRIFAYAVFLCVFLYLIGFLANQYTPSTIDSGLQIPPAEAWPRDLALLALFALQHSVMARPWYKRAARALIPPQLHRSTYVLMTCAALAAIFRYWEPVPDLVWHVRHPICAGFLHALYLAAWGLVAIASVQIGHAELTGLRHEPASPEFKTPGLYRFIRHPMMLGLLLALWATPAMSRGHLLFSAFLSGYIFLALRWEERDLERAHPDHYPPYRRRVGRLLPR